MAIFVERVGELPRLLDALQYHPEGLRIDDLAVEVGRTPAQVREALLTYYTTDLALYDADLVGRPPAIEFSGPGRTMILIERRWCVYRHPNLGGNLVSPTCQ